MFSYFLKQTYWPSLPFPALRPSVTLLEHNSGCFQSISVCKHTVVSLHSFLILSLTNQKSTAFFQTHVQLLLQSLFACKGHVNNCIIQLPSMNGNAYKCPILLLTTHSSASCCAITPYYKSAQLSAQLLNHSDTTLTGFVFGQFNVTVVWACDCKEEAEQQQNSKLFYNASKPPTVVA